MLQHTLCSLTKERKLSIGYRYFILLLLVIIVISGCKKIVEINPPVSTVPSSFIFSTNAQATSAIAGIYSQMINIEGIGFCSGAITAFCGSSSDEMIYVNGASYEPFYQFNVNTLRSDNPELGSFWKSPFTFIYGANAVIAGVNSSGSIGDSVKNELIGEAKFIRALCYFYLTNLFGDLPLVTTIDYHQTSLLPRVSSSDIYEQIISDLKDARDLLQNDYSVSAGERVRPNKAAASALLARVYLYKSDWENAESEATSVINNSSTYSLSSNLSDVFTTNSSEAIFQLKKTTECCAFNGTAEGIYFIPYDRTSVPNNWCLTNSLVSSFESGDQRRDVWVDSTTFMGTTYFFPFKYVIGSAEMYSSPQSQYYVVLRLGEQYLIRAEAKARQNKFAEATADLNIIRSRAGLPDLSSSLDQIQLMTAIEHERRIELFAEWGHRWFDLKRWNRTDDVLAPIKSPNWQSTDQFYPIPLQELISDPNLTQNPGY